jgi:histidinol-phosphate phosphatase family protein
MNRAVFLDRDGVINQRAPQGKYITEWKDFQFLPEVREAIGILNQSGLLVIVVTNQRCVAKGLIAIHELEVLHQRMCEELAKANARIDAVYYCPHEKYPPCWCRKPAPGMLLEAAREWQIDLAVSWMIGDSEIDIQAGRIAGCKTAWVLNAWDETKSESDVVGQSLHAVALQIVQYVNPPNSRATNRTRI